MPGKMTFEEYFKCVGDQRAKAIAVFVGLSPAMLQMSYLVDPSAADFENHKGHRRRWLRLECWGHGIYGIEDTDWAWRRADCSSGLHFDAAFRNKLAAFCGDH